MGSQHSHEKGGSEGGGGSGSATPRRGSRRGAGDAEAEVAPSQSPLVPVEKLGKILSQRSQKEDGVNGVTEAIFVKYLFPKYPELGSRVFQHLRREARPKHPQPHLPPSTFRAQAERLLALLDDEGIVHTYVRMFSANNDDDGSVTRDGLKQLLLASYRLSMDHFPDGPQACFMVEKTLSAVVAGCFGQRDRLAVGCAVRWLREHCPRLVLPVHRYVVHVVTTAHRSLEADSVASTQLSLGTPVLDEGGDRALLCASAAWLLAAAAPPAYSLPRSLPHPGGVSSSTWLSRLVCLVPRHWTPLYASRDHGLGANRFLHHVTSYRGPTMMLVAAGDLLLAVGSPAEWRESLRYWGGDDCVLLQMYPTFAVVEVAAKMLFLNTHLRGAPLGLRVGSDPKAPLLQINEDFDRLSFQGEEHELTEIEVWGCGEASSREAQLDVKKWQEQEAERNRRVLMSPADWLEHPDRYLLALAGRPQYNTSAS